MRRSMSPAGANRVIDAVPQASGRQLRNLVVVLGWLRGAAIERTLTRLLGKADVHHELIEAIVRFGPTVVDRLIEQLKQEDFETRNAAVVALGRIGDPSAVPALVSLLEEEPELLVPVAGALGRIGDARAFEPLLSLLGHGSVSVRHAAIGALNSIGHPEMAARIRRLLEDPRQQRPRIGHQDRRIFRLRRVCRRPAEVLRRRKRDGSRRRAGARRLPRRRPGVFTAR